MSGLFTLTPDQICKKKFGRGSFAIWWFFGGGCW